MRRSRPGASKLLLKDPYFGLLLVAPIVIWILGTLIYPLIEAVNLSLHNVGYVGTKGEFVGLSNYQWLVNWQPFWSSVGTTLIWTIVNSVAQLGLALASALVLNQDFVGKTFLRNWIVLPWTFPPLVLATLGKWVLDPSLGVVNYVFLNTQVINTPIAFLGSVQWAPIAVTALNVWRWFPFFTVVLLAALRTIPIDLYEASAIDRAARWQQLLYIEIPSLMPVFRVQLLIATLWSVNIFDIIWLLTRGGPASATTTLPILVYLKGFQEFRISQAATISVALFILLLAYAVLYFRRIRRTEVEQ